MSTERTNLGGHRVPLAPGLKGLIAATLLGWALLLMAQEAGAQEAAAQEAGAPLADMTGAACRSEARTDILPDPEAPAPVYLYCGAKGHPTGAVSAIVMPLTLPAEEAARRQAVEKTAAATPAGRAAADRMSCGAGNWMRTEDGLEVMIKSCALNDGQWPQILVLAGIGRFLLQAEGLPATLPVLERVMSDLAQYRAPEGKEPFGGQGKAAALLAAALGEQPRLIGGGDYDRYNELTEKARLENSRKAYREAEDAYRAALAIQERAFGPDAPGVGKVLMDLALEVSNQGRFEESAALFRRADPIVQKSPNQADQARYFTYMAFDAANDGRFADGLRYAREAASIWRGLAASDATSIEDLTGGSEARSMMRGELAHALNLEAAMAWRVGELANAEAAAKEALTIVGEERGLPPWWRPEILTTLGEIYARQERYKEAEQSFRGALIYQQRLFGDSAPTAMTLLALGRVYAGEGLPADAVRAYEFAMRILAVDELGKAEVVFDQIAPLLDAAAAEAQLHPDQREKLDGLVFRAVQLSSGGVADQTIAQASSRVAAENPQVASLVDRLQEADRQRDAARIELAHETSLPDDQRGYIKENQLLARINEQNSLRTSLLAQIAKDFPDYARLANPGAVALPELQRRLGADEALVVFETGRERAGAMVIRHDRFAARLLDTDRARIDDAVRNLRQAFAVRRGGFDEFDLGESFALYRTLFGPVENDLTGVGHLVVVANGALASLPPALLVSQRPESRDYRRAAWLVRRFAISQAPSVAAFVSLRDRARGGAPPRPFLGIGNPLFTGSSGQKGGPSALQVLGQCRADGPVPPELLRALAPLPETANELRAVAKALGAGPESIHLAADATEAMLRSQPLGDYRVIYFATHGLLPGELSCRTEPSLALSPPAVPATSKRDDGLLEAGEIAGLRLKADLVVLSACNTAESTTRFGGEALSGLAQAFFYAGARTLIASHWQVPSGPTAALMTGLFERLGTDHAAGTAQSLRQSQLALLDQPATAHPFFWAAFTVVGDGGNSAELRTAGETEGAAK